MNEFEALQESVTQLINYIEKNYKKILTENNIEENALIRFTYLTQVIDMMADAPAVEGVMLQAIVLRLYEMRNEVATEAEFIRIMTQ